MSLGGKIFKFYAWQKKKKKKKAEFLRCVTLTNGNGREWVDKSKMGM